MEQENNNTITKTYLEGVLDDFNDYYHKIPDGQKKFIRRGLLVCLLIYTSLFTWTKIAQPDISGVTTGSEMSISLSPSEMDITSGPQNIEIKIDSTVQIAFIHLELTFDKTKVNIASAPEIIGPLTRIVAVTSSSTANATGRLLLILALDPAYANTPPSGNFSIGRIAFKSVTSESNVTTQVNIDDGATKVVKAAGSMVVFSSYGTAIMINASIPSEPTTPPTVITSCAEYCASVGYSAGTCRKNSGQCKKNYETYKWEGNKYCGSASLSACCCLK